MDFTLKAFADIKNNEDKVMQELADKRTPLLNGRFIFL